MTSCVFVYFNHFFLFLECRKHRTQRVFMYESIVGKRVLNVSMLFLLLGFLVNTMSFYVSQDKTNNSVVLRMD